MESEEEKKKEVGTAGRKKNESVRQKKKQGNETLGTLEETPEMVRDSNQHKKRTPKEDQT